MAKKKPTKKAVVKAKPNSALTIDGVRVTDNPVTLTYSETVKKAIRQGAITLIEYGTDSILNTAGGEQADNSGSDSGGDTDRSE